MISTKELKLHVSYVKPISSVETEHTMFFNLAPNRHFDDGAAAKEPTELFAKNTGLCEHESGCIGADSCPVSEG